MFRLIIFGILIYFAYRLFKNLLWTTGRVSGKNSNGNVVSEMVQDPFCKTYIPRNEARRIVLDGTEYHFCSDECAEKFKDKAEAV